MSPAFLPILMVVLLAFVGVVGLWGGARLSRPAETAVNLLAAGALGAALFGAIGFAMAGQASVSLLTWGPVGLGSRLDIVSVTMLCLIGFLAWVILRYAVSYLRGERGQGRFVGYLALTLASVTALVQAGNLFQLAVFWVLTSIFLHRLLLFCADRTPAIRAQRKKFVIARMGDVALISAIVLTFMQFNTLDIAALSAAATAIASDQTVWPIVMLFAIAAVMKSAQFPTHGWITEVMETPTPVSAVLHAGIVNAGGFLLIRLADVIVLSPAMMVGIALIGLVTAILGSAVMITQPAVKTRLAWSTISQMGLMIVQCGLGLFVLALMHIVAHSLYKSYAFLSSGGTIEKLHSLRKDGPAQPITKRFVLIASLGSLLVCGAVGLMFGALGKPPQLIALAIVLVLAIWQFLIATQREGSDVSRLMMGAVLSVGICSIYFALHALGTMVAAGAFPSPADMYGATWLLLGVVILGFAALGAFQTYVLCLSAPSPRIKQLYVHLSNGLYINSLIDRVAGTWQLSSNAPPLGGEKS